MMHTSLSSWATSMQLEKKKKKRSNSEAMKTERCVHTQVLSHMLTTVVRTCQQVAQTQERKV